MYKYICWLMIIGAPLVKAEEADQGSYWTVVGQQAGQSVVRVLCYGSECSWTEPYKTPKPFSCSGTAFFIEGATFNADLSKKYLITNYHVIACSDAVFVTLPQFGQKVFPVSIVGACPEWDIALLQLSDESKEYIEREGQPIQPLLFADSDKVYQTQPVLAIGYPLGSGIKTTSGAVAGRDFRNQSLIHITAPINPGNSGGPLLTKDGKVVGINTATMRNAQNYNYVIPSNDILAVLPDMYSKGLVHRSFIGIFINKTTEAHARFLGNPIPAGAYVSSVLQNSIGDRSGIKKGDMLYEVIMNGESFAVNENGEVSVPWRKHEKISVAELLARHRRADSLACVVYRNGKRILLEGSFEEENLFPIREVYVDFEPKEKDFEIVGGLVCMQLRVNHIESLQMMHGSNASFLPINNYMIEKKRGKQVLVVTHIFPGSQADLSRCFFPGCLLKTINEQPVSSLEELRTALCKSLKTGVISFSTKDDLTTVFDLKKVIDEELALSSRFRYELTEGMKKLLEHTEEEK